MNNNSLLNIIGGARKVVVSRAPCKMFHVKRPWTGAIKSGFQDGPRLG